MLRRSLIGSLRSVSPFASTSLATESSFRSDSRQSGTDTPASQKEPRILRTIPETERGPAPELDRSVDLVVTHNKPIEVPLFEQLLAYDKFTRHDHIQFTLPVYVRRRIYGYCFPDEHRKICLSPRFATKAVFPDGHFASPWDVLDPVFGGIHTSQELRHELMTYFWTEYHFHVTVSPFTGPKFSPLSHIWLPLYLDVIQHLTVEVDLTRLGFSALRAGPEFGHEIQKIEGLFTDIVNGVTRREGLHLMEEFNIMCRRYAGFRPYGGADDATFEYTAVPYCPDHAQYLCDAYCDLRGIVRKSRISGFTLEYTEMLFNSTFSDGHVLPDYDWGFGSPWPEVIPPQTPYQNFRPSFNADSAPPMPIRKLELPFSPTSTFTHDVEDEMRKYESSVYSEKTTIPAEDTPIKNGILKSETSSTLAEHVQKYSRCVVSTVGSDASKWSSPRIRFSGDSERHLLAASPHLNSEIATPETPALEFETVTPKTGEKLERMNEQNEQDPAFVKSVEALRSLSEDLTFTTMTAKEKPRPKSMIPSPKPRIQDDANGRSQASIGTHTRAEGTVRRYLSFVKRLRGRDG